MKSNIIAIGLGTIAVTGVAALPVLNQDIAVSLDPRAELAIETPQGADLVARAVPDVEASQVADLVARDEEDYRANGAVQDKGLGYSPNSYNGRYDHDWEQWGWSDFLRRLIMYYRRDKYTCGFGFENHGMC
ncbi:hypothetical protein CLAFUR4_02724 [Fulvia fulva]|nr:hypothetical protein CLAFUR4_02724 [Fulvia fulva]WPV25966.1 hypothetical protein CLAFUW7_02728 [Fulvia fulva]